MHLRIESGMIYTSHQPLMVPGPVVKHTPTEVPDLYNEIIHHALPYLTDHITRSGATSRNWAVDVCSTLQGERASIGRTKQADVQRE